jgi:cytosine/adenosine deaminase-related metal-dependent hydrolase
VGCLGAHVTVVHATHADGGELDLLAESATTICACPTTEADLADGFLPAARIEHRGIPLSIGSDSNARIDPLEELREVEGIARRQTGKRGVFSAERLLCFGADEGARSLGLESWPEIEVDLAHASLRGVDSGDVFDALVSSCSAEVLEPVSRA